MTSIDPLPRGSSEIDDEIKRVRKELKDAVRLRRLAILIFILVLAVEVVFIVMATRTPGGMNGGWGAAVVLYGVVVFMAVAGIGVLLFGNDEDAAIINDIVISFDATRRLRMEIEKLTIERRDVLVGTGRGQSVVYARYRESLPELVARYRTQANHYRTSSNALQAFAIIASLTTSAITGLFGSSNHVRIGVVGLTLATAVASSMGAFFRLRDRSGQLQKTADLIETEFRAVELGINNYSGMKKEDALRIFVQKVEDIRTEHMAHQRQLDQPADVRYLDPSSISVHHS